MKTTIEIRGTGIVVGAIAHTIWIALTTFGYSCRLECNGIVTEPCPREDGTFGPEVEVVAKEQGDGSVADSVDRLQ